MPTRNSKSRLSEQEKKRRAQARQREKLLETKRREKAKAAWLKKQAKERDKALEKLLKNVRGKGIYDPKSLELTPYRRKRAKSIGDKFGELLDPAKYFFVPLPKKVRKSALEKARKINISTIRDGEEFREASKTGLFIAKKNYTKARLTIDKKSGELGITKSGKTKHGPNRGKQYKEHLPLVDFDELTRSKERLRKMAERLGPLKKGETLAFSVTENGASGYSKNIYKNIDFLLKDLEKYEMITPARVQFYRHISIVKVKATENWYEMHPRTDAGFRGKAARRRINAKGRNY